MFIEVDGRWFNSEKVVTIRDFLGYTEIDVSGGYHHASGWGPDECSVVVFEGGQKEVYPIPPGELVKKLNTSWPR